MEQTEQRPRPRRGILARPGDFLIGAVAILAVLAAGLWVWASGTDFGGQNVVDDPDLEPGEDVVSEPYTEPEPATHPDAEDAEPGDVFDFDPGSPPDDNAAYAATDDTFHIVDPEQPVSDDIESDLGKRLSQALPASSDDMSQWAHTVEELAEQLTKELGQPVALVYTHGGTWEGWVRTGNNIDVASGPDYGPEEAAEAIKDKAAERGEPDILVVIADE